MIYVDMSLLGGCDYNGINYRDIRKMFLKYSRNEFGRERDREDKESLKSKAIIV